MLKERLEAAAAIRADFIAAEASTDMAAIHATRCISHMLEERARAKLPLGVGLQASARIAEATSALVKARQLFIEAHSLMRELPGQARLPERLSGDTGDCPPVDPPSGAYEGLHLVGKA